MFALLFSRRWLLSTLLVIVAAAVMARLGIWQLDRLEARRAFNARVLEQVIADPLQLDEDALSLDLYAMEYRQTVVTGEYMPEDEIVLRNQVWQGQAGMTLFTPLRIAGADSAILVERGWIPAEQADRQSRAVYHSPGTLTLTGVLRRAETDFEVYGRIHPDPTLSADQQRLDVWNNLDLERIAAQMETPLLPVYLEQAPDPGKDAPPYAALSEPDLSEGPHQGYAIQWFIFAAILGLGYPFFVRRQEIARSTKSDQGNYEHPLAF